MSSSILAWKPPSTSSRIRATPSAQAGPVGILACQARNASSLPTMTAKSASLNVLRAPKQRRDGGAGERGDTLGPGRVQPGAERQGPAAFDLRHRELGQVAVVERQLLLRERRQLDLARIERVRGAAVVRRDSAAGEVVVELGLHRRRALPLPRRCHRRAA